jgi:hypothetical protein
MHSAVPGGLERWLLSGDCAEANITKQQNRATAKNLFCNMIGPLSMDWVV